MSSKSSINVSVEIDRNNLSSYTDEFLQTAWFLCQYNPAPRGDRDAGELVEAVGREIIRRWLGAQQPPLWNRTGCAHYHSELMKYGCWHKDGTEYRPHAAVFAENVARDIRSIAGMDPADGRIPKMLKAIQCEAEKLVGPISS